MCEVWKWIIIFEAPFLIVGYIYARRRLDIGWFRWTFRNDPDGWRREYEKVRWYLPTWWLGVFVLFFSIIIYGVHCAS
jgi:hypothetical protein